MEEEYPSPKSLRKLASAVKYPGGNSLLHQLVLDYSDNNLLQNKCYIKLILFSISGVDVNAVNDEGFTALHLAVMKGNLLMLKILLNFLPDIDVNKGINKRIQMHYGSDRSKTALHMAAETNNLPMLQELLEKGANVNKADEYGDTPLHIAVFQDNLDMIRFVLDRERDVNVDKLLIFAAKLGRLKIVKFLIDEKEADVNFQNEGGYTPLHLAAVKGHLCTVEFLVSRGVDICAGYPFPSSDLHVLRFLLDRGANLDLEQSFLDAALYDKMETVQFLVEKKGVDVNVADEWGDTALHRAVALRNANLTLWLIEAGADTNHADKRGKTPRHFAKEYNPKDISWLERGTNRDTRDRHGNESPRCSFRPRMQRHLGTKIKTLGSQFHNLFTI